MGVGRILGELYSQNIPTPRNQKVPEVGWKLDTEAGHS